MVSTFTHMRDTAMILRTHPPQERLLARAAFTLMELIVVIAIIVALAGIGGYFLIGAIGQSKEQIAEVQVKQTLTKACQTYFVRYGQWPTTLEELISMPQQKGDRPILDDPTAILDPWERPYVYDSTGPNNGGLKPDISCQSPDTGKTIGNWPQLKQQQ